MALAKNSMEGKAEGFLKRIETMQAEMESAEGTYMAECRERREDIKEIYTEAKDAGAVTRESLMQKTNAELDEVMSSLGQKVDADASKGDKVERILRFLGGLDQMAEKDAAKNRTRKGSK